jgi:hypothetical protein
VNGADCRRCQVPLLSGATPCPYCGVDEPASHRLSSGDLFAWLLSGAVALSITSVLVDALSRAVA